MCMFQRMPVCLSDCSPRFAESPRLHKALQQTCVEQIATHSWMLWLWVKALAQRHPCITSMLHQIYHLLPLSGVTCFDPQPEHYLVLRYTDPCHDISWHVLRQKFLVVIAHTHLGPTLPGWLRAVTPSTTRPPPSSAFGHRFGCSAAGTWCEYSGVPGSAGVLDPRWVDL